MAKQQLKSVAVLKNNWIENLLGSLVGRIRPAKWLFELGFSLDLVEGIRLRAP
tara:strand:+ start:543 stop:701 length:159 start_codon:yes stop_codon:yes gene_type:complete